MKIFYVFVVLGVIVQTLSPLSALPARAEESSVVLDGCTTAETATTNTEESAATDEAIVEQSAVATTGYVLLNEFVSNPAEGDEWVEIVNQDSVAVDITNWYVTDATAKQTALTNQVLEPGAFALIAAPKGKLNNDGDTISLFDATGLLADSVTYGTDEIAEPDSGESLGRQTDGTWTITEQMTPGSANIFAEAVVEAAATENAETADEEIVAEETTDASGTIVITTSTESELPKSQETKPKEAKTAVTITSVEGVAEGSLVTLTAQVIALPGTFGSQSMLYLEGAPVYLHDADWPALALGDVVMVEGIVTSSRNELRIKLKDATDIVATDHQELAPRVLRGEEIATSSAPSLVQVSGTILARSGSTLSLDVDGVTVEITAKAPTGISWSALGGSTLTVTGVLRRIDGEVDILPRGPSDIVVEAGTVGAATALADHQAPWLGAGLLTSTVGALGYWFRRSRTATSFTA